MNTKGSRMDQRVRSFIQCSTGFRSCPCGRRGPSCRIGPDQAVHAGRAHGRALPLRRGEWQRTRDALGDRELTLRVRRTLWSRRAGFGSTARFERRPDDANVLVGPVNNDKLHLRGCTREWTIEAWVRYTGPGGEDGGHAFANIADTEDEGFGLPLGFRGGRSFSLHNRGGTLADGLGPSARFMGSLRGKDPNHDTSGLLFPYYRGGGIPAPNPSVSPTTGGIMWPGSFATAIGHTSSFLTEESFERFSFRFQDPPFHLAYGNVEGEIDELRISSVMRYPVAQELVIDRTLPSRKLPPGVETFSAESRTGLNRRPGGGRNVRARTCRWRTTQERSRILTPTRRGGACVASQAAA